MGEKKIATLETAVVTRNQGERKIYLIRGDKVMLDSELAELYDVETKMLTRAVKRNIDRFPDDFMFQLTASEMTNLRRQIGASSSKNHGGRRYMPYVFTEQGACDVVECFEQRAGGAGEYRDQAGVCKYAKIGRDKRGSQQKTGCDRAKTRNARRTF